MTDSEEKILRQQLNVAFGSLNLAMRQMSQVTRCLTLAMFAEMQGNREKSVSELSEISGRLDEVNENLHAMMKHAEDIANAAR